MAYYSELWGGISAVFSGSATANRKGCFCHLSAVKRSTFPHWGILCVLVYLLPCCFFVSAEPPASIFQSTAAAKRGAKVSCLRTRDTFVRGDKGVPKRHLKPAVLRIPLARLHRTKREVHPRILINVLLSLRQEWTVQLTRSSALSSYR